jgi:hypothetical protein
LSLVAYLFEEIDLNKNFSEHEVLEGNKKVNKMTSK